MEFKNYTSLANKTANQTTTKNDEVNTVEVQKNESSLLDLSYTHKTTFDVGKVVPIFQMECYPGDSFTIDVTTLLKMSIPSAPTMDAPRYDINFFFVPWEQVFPNFSDIIGTKYSGGSPQPATDIPTINYSTASSSSNFTLGVNDVGSHMEVPIGINLMNIGFNISALPFRAYVKVWDEWYRDENLQAEADYTNSQNINSSVDFNGDTWNLVGNTNPNNVQYGFGLLQANRLRDYFASCLPFIQKGEIPTISTLDAGSISNLLNNTAVNFPALDLENNSNATAFSPNVYWNNTTSVMGNVYPLYVQTGDGTTGNNVGNLAVGNSTSNPATTSANIQVSTKPTFIDASEDLFYYYGGGLGNFNVTDLRTALVKQHQQELDARAGTRYYEKLLSYWGIETNPLEIGRSEFIGGWHDVININNVVQTAPQNSGANTPLGTIGGLSITTGKLPNIINYSCSQYGIILGLICVRTNISYSQGLPRMFTKIKNYDFYNPSFNGISEQPIYKYELYLDANGTTNNMQIFGYNQPWADLKYKPNVCSGYLSANATDTYYQMYTYQNALSGSPTLSNSWMYYPASALENTLLMNASSQVENINDFIGDFAFTVKCSREIPAYSVPGVDKI